MGEGIAVYAGSFDPLTIGHVDLIQRGAALFGSVVVAVGNNMHKDYWFNIEQRERMVNAVCEGMEDVRVVPFSGLLVDLCQSLNADAILRGLRALSDFDIEFRNGLANRDLAGIETVFLLTDPQNIFVSSSLVKEIFLNGGDVSSYVPEVVLSELALRRNNP